ncbi:MAG: DNA topoisomerase VI subunit B [Planctomycetaceae bacterium]|nr:DNA topoisomerase VI subunit B [Planctomycetaceae bacterium]
MAATKPQKEISPNQMSFDFNGNSAASETGILEQSPAEEPETETKSKKSKKKTDTSAKGKKPRQTSDEQSEKSAHPKGAASAESMAAKQRDISISEFFAKNRHLLGFDNPRKALLTAIKEAVDNSLDACEDAKILPDITVTIKQLTEKKFTIVVKDNGPGIVSKQVPNVFAKLLYGSKFHSLKMSRGQQGIGISAAGMYGLLTTGEPVQIISRTDKNKKAYHCHVQIDTTKNKPMVILDEDCDFDLPTGTQVTVTLEGKYQKGKQSVDDYIAQTAMANPHATVIYNSPDNQRYEYVRQTKELPFAPVEIKPHPYGVELGLLYKMARETTSKHLSQFLQNDFSRISPKVGDEICKKAGISKNAKSGDMSLKEVEAVHNAINETKIMAPPVNCIGPIGESELEKGLKRVVEADFYAACTRKPDVYRGNPFLIEAAIAYGFKTEHNGNNDDPDKLPQLELKRFANRVPLLYQQSACAIHKAVVDTNWRNYNLSQSRGALPMGPIVLMIHMASVWVPFTSESKEAIAHYPEIIKEIKLAIQECGRLLGMYLRKQKRIKMEMQKRGYIETYLPFIGEALKEILTLKDEQVKTIVSRLKEVLEKTRQI